MNFISEKLIAELPDFDDIEFKLSELTKDNRSCNETIRMSIAVIKQNIDAILR